MGGSLEAYKLFTAEEKRKQDRYDQIQAALKEKASTNESGGRDQHSHGTMSNGATTVTNGAVHTPEPYDILIVGAGFSGVCALHHLRERFPDWRIKVIEAGSSSGGTWYWNRYPGARFDSESVSYAFSWDKELLDTWHWKESFSPQPETLKYVDLVCRKHELYKDMQFNTQVKSAQWQEQQRTWLFTDEEGHQYETRFFVSCIGFLSAPTLPNIPGVEAFKGQSFHTSRWPRDLDLNRDFAGKRVGMIGTGATAIQSVTEIAKVPGLKSFHLFQRTANWSAPLHNTEITPEQMAKFRTEYDMIFKRCAETPMCFIHEADPRVSLDISEADRRELWEKLYSEPGFGKWIGAFKDTYTNREANKLYSDFMADKIRQRVHDPATANKLIPKNHGFGTRRVPLESGYFETFNKANVHLVDLKETPITEITATGVQTSTDHIDLDILIYATGFDAITGAYNAIDFHAKDDRPLIGSSSDNPSDRGNTAIWLDHRPQTYLGLTIRGMPNTFMILGPHQPFGNATRSIEHAVDVVSDLLAHCKEKGITYVEPTQDAVDKWTKHVHEASGGLLSNEVDSWMTGVNHNVKGKTVRSVARYSGSAVEFRRRCEEVKGKGWAGLEFQ
ncbi:2-oxo-Delta(3)-4,5,5-trimethylcyclopentenylacetyl-CoA monooxygenase [Cyphellophora attinorum]|uniref:2-oxo-Delta(3)-4,5, 5-trimethylcyclopentenylacetyl-CoA monooxygenase n=1 Tax=Cyphellophora attinorum TaxID=1664694 RepID=A0A0N1HDC5_9EURO|nr:2-oxo-Delta(3)-4,5,5-trimethylcyclopentenylacetyl-CoA monooxygenase [Phialophora attinorum]KPI42610.1 2-oxo-Delta(3)-4,5,5-trimethylcyclopentenylacetyl-CoA monooxygenase [Phialophora attinorum]